MTAAGPVVLVLSTRATASGSASSVAWSPSDAGRHQDQVHLAQAGRGRRPRRRGSASTSVTSSVMVSTSGGPQCLELLGRRGQPDLVAADEHDAPQPTAPPGRAARPGRCPRSRRPPPPSGASPWRRSRCPRRLGSARPVAARAGGGPVAGLGRARWPRAPGAVGPADRAGDGTRPEAPGQVRDEHAGGVDPGPHRRATRARRGYMASSSSGRRRASLARYTRPPAPATISSSASSRGPERGGPDREVEAGSSPRSGTTAGPGSPGPNRFSTARNDGHAALAQPREHGAQGVLGAEGHDELVLDEAPRAVHAVPGADAVERVEVGRRSTAARPPGPGGLAEPQLVEGRHRHGVEQARRRGHRHLGPHDAGRSAARRRRRARGEVLEPGVVAPGEHGPAHGAAPGQAVDPRHRVPVLARRARPCGRGSRRGSAARSVSTRMVAVSHREHPQRGVDHDPGQSHATGGGPEQVGVALGRDLDAPAGVASDRRVT